MQNMGYKGFTLKLNRKLTDHTSSSKKPWQEPRKQESKKARKCKARIFLFYYGSLYEIIIFALLQVARVGSFSYPLLNEWI